MILLKDGVKYLPYEYRSEEELAKMVAEHIREIFGANSLYFDPQTMKTQIGIIARNDGMILTIDKNRWFILEVELAKHPLPEHIIPQITKFSIAYEDTETRRKIVNTMYNAIRGDPIKTAIMKQQNIQDLHKTLTDLIDTQPTITIIIDQKTPELDALCKKLPFQTQTIEFKTYARENIGIGEHIHEFKQLFEEIPPPPTTQKRISKAPSEDEFLKALIAVVGRQRRPATSRQIADELGLFEVLQHPRDTVRRIMSKLAKAEKVKITLAPKSRREKYLYEPIS